MNMKANDLPARADYHFSDDHTVRETVTVLLCPYTIQCSIELLGSIKHRNEAQKRDYDRLSWLYSLITASDRTGLPVLVQS